MLTRKLRIAFATPEYVTEPYFDGGLAQYLYRTTRALGEMGHDVHVITLSHNEEPPFVHDGVTVHRVMLKNGWQTLNRATAYRLPISTHWLNLSAQVYRRLRKLNAREPLDIVQFPNYSYCGLFSILFSGVPHVLRLSSIEHCLHDAEKKRTLDFKILEWLERRQFRRSRNVFSPSHALQKMHAKKYGLPLASVIRSPIYLETTSYDLTIYEQFLSDREYLLFFGRFEQLKGFEILVKSLSQVLAAEKSINAVLIGRDVTTSSVPSMAEFAYDVCGKFGSRFLMLEQLRHARLYPIISRAKFVVLPSLVDTLPNACLEAMALATPVIGTVGTGLDELITDEENGFLVEAGNVDALTEKILYAWAHPKLNEIGAAAQQKSMEFSAEKTTSALVNYYQRILQAAPKTSTQRILSNPAPS